MKGKWPKRAKTRVVLVEKKNGYLLKNGGFFGKSGRLFSQKQNMEGGFGSLWKVLPMWSKDTTSQ